jgi:hypothetical protein
MPSPTRPVSPVLRVLLTDSVRKVVRTNPKRLPPYTLFLLLASLRAYLLFIRIVKFMISDLWLARSLALLGTVLTKI